jgi:hypothetical protein
MELVQKLAYIMQPGINEFVLCLPGVCETVHTASLCFIVSLWMEVCASSSEWLVSQIAKGQLYSLYR